jgi:hypothetical protein
MYGANGENSGNSRLKFYTLLFIPLAASCLCSGCSGKNAAHQIETGGEAAARAETEAAPSPAYPAADKLLAIVKPAGDPIWFELGPDGPIPLASAAEASLAPYRPWTAARFVTGMILEPDRLIMAVNGDGFLVWVPLGGSQNGAAALYRLPEPAWDGLTVAALFRCPPEGGGGRAAALLYRDRVFSAAGGEAPEQRVRALPPGGFEAETLYLPAFDPLPAAENWNLESLRQGRDGAWYFRGARDGVNPASVYYRAEEFSSPGHSVNAGLFRNAVSPYTYKEAPPVLRGVLEDAAALAGDETAGVTLVAAVISPDYDAPRYFTGGGDLSDVTEVSGYYLPPSPPEEFPGGAPGREPFAAALFPDGRLLYATGEGGAVRAALPALPDGFVYTRFGVSGAALLAAWEEQLEWNTGAAGFMVINTAWADPLIYKKSRNTSKT